MKVPQPYLLDTNTVGFIVNGRSAAARQKLKEAMAQRSITISAVTQGEILFGLVRRPEATRLRSAVEALFRTVQILPWDSASAVAYGTLRQRLEATGKSLDDMDMLIAAHASATGAILVTHDEAFRHATPLIEITDWSTDI